MTILKISVTTLVLAIPRSPGTIVKSSFPVHRLRVITTELARTLKITLITSVLVRKRLLEKIVSWMCCACSWSLVKMVEFVRIFTIYQVSVWRVMLASVRVIIPGLIVNIGWFVKNVRFRDRCGIQGKLKAVLGLFVLNRSHSRSF